jgi:homoserine/homoserine lactone efflux protein
MDFQNWVLLLAAKAVNSVVPGPGILLVVGVSAVRGFGAGVWVTLGMAIGTLVLLGVVWAVMAGTMVLSENGLDLLRLAGVAVLLGLALLLLFGTPVDRVAAPGLQAGRFGRRWLGDCGGGFLAALTSPVHLVFMLALLPQFVPFQEVSQAEIALITAALVVMTSIPMLAAAAFGAGTGRLGLGWARHVQRGSGVALLGFAAMAVMVAP